MRTLALITAFLTLAAPAVAQDQEEEIPQAQQNNRNARRGFWIGAGLGTGSEKANCVGCSSNRAHGPAGYIRLGGTLTKKLLLGVQATAWSITALGVEQSIGIGTVDLYWYPTSMPLYLKMGVGGLSYNRRPTRCDSQICRMTETRETAPVVGLGAGFEFRVLRDVSVVPFINAFGSSPVKRETQYSRNSGSERLVDPWTEVSTGGDLKREMVQLGIGVTLH